jgi:hypothetical protein
MTQFREPRRSSAPRSLLRRVAGLTARRGLTRDRGATEHEMDLSTGGGPRRRSPVDGKQWMKACDTACRK